MRYEEPDSGAKGSGMKFHGTRYSAILSNYKPRRELLYLCSTQSLNGFSAGVEFEIVPNVISRFMKLLKFCAAIFLALSAGSANAVLFDRGGGLIYDDVLNVTWLQDANYARSSGFASDGVLKGYQAVSWASNLSYYDSVRKVTYSDWRLPTVRPLGSDWNYQFSTDGTTDWGPNNTSPKNEMSYMYFVNLGLNSFFNPDGSANPNFGVFGDGTTSGQRTISASGVTIYNLNASAYWTGTKWELPQNGGYYYNFNTAYGETNAGDEYMGLYAWAVRDGDVSPVPFPPAFVLMLSGLAFLSVSKRCSRGENPS